jgi:hypothetical protein
LKGECRECGGHIEFPAESAGMMIDCPHCGKGTELLLALPPEEPGVPRRTIVWMVAGTLVLLLGLGASLVALKLAQRRWGRGVIAPAREATPVAKTNAVDVPALNPADVEVGGGFRVSAITLEKTPGSSLVYAVGTLTNPSDRQRFGVKVELDLLDSAGQKVGATKDYQQIIEPNGQWRFRALVVGNRATAARVASVKEDQ